MLKSRFEDTGCNCPTASRWDCEDCSGQLGKQVRDISLGPTHRTCGSFCAFHPLSQSPHSIDSAFCRRCWTRALPSRTPRWRNRECIFWGDRSRRSTDPAGRSERRTCSCRVHRRSLWPHSRESPKWPKHPRPSTSSSVFLSLACAETQPCPNEKMLSLFADGKSVDSLSVINPQPIWHRDQTGAK